MNFMPAFRQATAKAAIFGEEAVAWVDAFRAGGFRRFDDFDDVEVAFRSGGRAEKVGFVGHADVEGVAVGLGVDGDGADAQTLAAADDAAGDFASVGYENFVEHGDWGNYTRLGWGSGRVSNPPLRMSGVWMMFRDLLDPSIGSG